MVLVLEIYLVALSHFLAYSRKLGNRRSSEGLRSFKPSRGTNLLVLIILAGDIEMNPGPRSQCRQCKKYCKATDKVVKCQECSKCFHVSCTNLSEKELGSEKETWYCKDCKAECGMNRLVTHHDFVHPQALETLHCQYLAQPV